MITRIASGIILLVSVYISVSHGMRTFSKPTEEYMRMMSVLGISETMRVLIGVWSMVTALLILFPHTFFVGNILRAIQLLLMMAFALKAGNYRFALIEIPFLLMPLLLIYLGYPLKK